MISEKIRSLGITPLTFGFIALLVVFGGLLSITRYLDLSATVEGSMEPGVVRAVQQGIAAYAAASRDRGRTPIYPPVLDEAVAGHTRPQNPFFSSVLEGGIAVDGWVKAGRYEYRGPSEASFIYNPRTGSFEKHGTENSK